MRKRKKRKRNVKTRKKNKKKTPPIRKKVQSSQAKRLPHSQPNRNRRSMPP